MTPGRDARQAGRTATWKTHVTRDLGELLGHTANAGAQGPVWTTSPCRMGLLIPAVPTSVTQKSPNAAAHVA